MSRQNTSAAVMQQRAEARDSLDFFPTPPWATRALLEQLANREVGDLSVQTAWDPACGAGDMQRVLAETFGQALASDVHDYGEQWRGAGGLYGVCDFLMPAAWPDWIARSRIDWIVTNPPFRLAESFVRVALARARVGVAMFVRTSFLEGKERYRAFFKPTPPTAILQFSDRVVIHAGRLLDPDVRRWVPTTADPDAFEWRKPSTATSYAWLVWLASGELRTSFDWIDAGARQRLTRPGDYPSLPVGECGPVGSGGLFGQAAP